MRNALLIPATAAILFGLSCTANKVVTPGSTTSGYEEASAQTQIFSLKAGSVGSGMQSFPAADFHIDSLTVDSVMNSDTSVYSQNEERRSFKISFLPVSTDSVDCFVDFWAKDSVDATYKWMYSRDILAGSMGESFYRVAPDQKSTRTMIMVSGDRDSVRFRVTCRTDTMSLGRLRLGTGIGGWTDSTATYVHFATAQELQSIIDGGYESYFANGIIEGFQHTAGDTAGHSAQITGCDFGTSVRAAAGYAAIANWTNNTVPVSTYGDSVAISYKVLGGMTTACHFNHFFAKFTLTGYPSSDSALVQADTKKFVDFYNQKSQLP